jgi:hypothetical protein
MSARPLALTVDSVPGDIPDYADALAGILEHHARMLRFGISTEDTARTLLPILRLAARIT